MIPDPTLTDEELAEWSSLHQPAGEAEGTYCQCCRRWWPCPEAKLIAALRVSREEVERLRELADFARLLGPARMVLDRCAMNGGDQERQDAADMAQRIVDLIGHPVTDEPPHALVERDSLRAEVERLRQDRAVALGLLAHFWQHSGNTDPAHPQWSNAETSLLFEATK